MAEIVTIRPKSGSKRFKAIKGQMSQFQKITEESGAERNELAGEYKSERFPNSRQMFRPMWGSSKRRWLMSGFDKFDTKEQNELNELVAKCKLKYGAKDPRAMQYITEADIYDSNDPFFNHKSLRVITYEGQVSLDKSRPLDKIILMALQADSQFQQGGETVNPMLSQRVRYVITDRNIDVKIKRAHRTKIMKSTKLYDNLTDNKKFKIAMSMGLISSEKTDRSIIDEVLWDACQDNKTKLSNKMSKQDLFISMCIATSEELNTRHMIQKAKASGNLKKNKQQGWLLFGEAISRTDAKLYEYFNNPDNQEILLRLENVLEDDQSN